MQNVLMTGAAGGIGTMFRTVIKNRYPRLLLSDIRQPADLATDEQFKAADLSDFDQVLELTRNIDGIIHFGGYSVEGPWEAIHSANIVGTYNLFEAARQNGVKRVVFASSNHVMGFYRRTQPVGIDAPVRPDSRYGVSKAFGEAIGALYADKHGLGVMNIRIGNVADKPVDKRRLAIWLHPDDLAQLIHIGLTHPELHYETVYGASLNERGWWDNSSAYRLGYRPAHRAEDFADHALGEQAKLDDDPIGDQFQGGGFCSVEFDSVPDRIV